MTKYLTVIFTVPPVYKERRIRNRNFCLFVFSTRRNRVQISICSTVSNCVETGSKITFFDLNIFFETKAMEGMR